MPARYTIVQGVQHRLPRVYKKLEIGLKKKKTFTVPSRRPSLRFFFFQSGSRAVWIRPSLAESNGVLAGKQNIEIFLHKYLSSFLTLCTCFYGMFSTNSVFATSHRCRFTTKIAKKLKMFNIFIRFTKKS